MTVDRFRPAVAPAYLFLCLLLGGSSQGVWGNAILRLLAVVLIAWAILDRREETLARPVKQLLGLFALAILLVIFQLIPLPVKVWTGLPGRELVVDGFQLLGLNPPPMPLSLFPTDSMAAVLALLPPRRPRSGRRRKFRAGPARHGRRRRRWPPQRGSPPSRRRRTAGFRV